MFLSAKITLLCLQLLAACFFFFFVFFIAVGFNNIYFIIYIHNGIAKNQATVFHRLRFLMLPSNQSLSRLCLSPSSPSHYRNSVQISSSLSQSSITLSSLPLSLLVVAAQPRSQLTLSRSSLPLSLIPVTAHSMPRRRRRRLRLVL